MFENVSYAGQPLFWFERNFDATGTVLWYHRYWSVYALSAGVFYLLLINILPRLLENVQPLKLKRTMLFWNVSIATFSIVGAYRTLPEMYGILEKNGTHETFCQPQLLRTSKICIYWSILFMLSKIIEFTDTAFLILRKRNVSFLHWYHHLTVMVYVFYVSRDFDPTCFFFGTMNLVVHGVMYTYYALTSIGLKPPKLVSMLVTSLQIAQMAAGCTILYIQAAVMARGPKCDVTTGPIIWGSIMYLSYLLLFVQFFYGAYIRNKKPKSA